MNYSLNLSRNWSYIVYNNIESKKSNIVLFNKLKKKINNKKIEEYKQEFVNIYFKYKDYIIIK